MNLRLRDDQQEALKQCAEEEGRGMHAIVLQAIDRYLEQEADRAAVRRLGAKYAAGHADLLRRLGEWMCTVVFLDFNGTGMLGVDQDEAYKLVIEVASGNLEDVGLIALRLRALHEAM